MLCLWNSKTVDAKSKEENMPRISFSVSNRKRVSVLIDFFFWASLLINGDKFRKSATWVFFQNGPIYFSLERFPQKVRDYGIFLGIFEHVFLQLHPAKQFMFLSLISVFFI